jgi:competence protein ComEC
MSGVIESNDEFFVANRRRRSPAVVIAIIACLGVLADRYLPFNLNTWLLLAFVAAALWLSTFSSRYQRCSVLCLLFGWCCLAGAWHHWRWNCRAVDDIGNSATNSPALVRLIGKIVQSPWIIRRPEGEYASWQDPEYSILILECRSLVTGTGEKLPVSGFARVGVDGAVTQATLGDLVEITGKLALPTEPANPGDFDRRAFLRTQGIFSVVHSDHPDGILVLHQERTFWDWLLVVRGKLRSRAERLIGGWLAPETAPVAQAMLLGSRVQIDEETRRAFRESGMLHVLAISGMNVGLLWTWLWSLSRWAGRSAQTSLWIILIALPLYAIITDANPPIVRATVVAVIIALGRLLGRTGSTGNALALAGLCVLAWNPSDLFNTGAQLSFLAVFAIMHATRWLALMEWRATEKEEDAPLNPSLFRYAGRRMLRALIEVNVVGIAVWLLTSPLVAREFHLVSPIGSLLTILLAAPVTMMFWIGYSFLLLGLISASLFGWLGILFDGLLSFFLWAVRAGANIHLGHVYIPAPPVWWIFGFYSLTCLPIFIDGKGRWGPALSVRFGLVWIALGLAWELNRSPERGVTCTFVSVGHGLSVLIECPNGRTALYDAGGMVGGGTVARTISHALWTTGRARLDAVVISHADGDHCNALPELNRIVAPGGLFVHRSFLDWKQPPVADAIERSASAGVPVRLLSEGQQLIVDPTVTINVLHPARDFRSPLDNPNSVVLSIEYSGRRILLTGDLEREGLETLLKKPPLQTDVLLSPHHGSMKANPPDLARWATPKYLIVSTPEAAVADRLAAQYGPETQILTTATCGAIRCHVSPDGQLDIQPFKKPPTRKN